MQLIRHLKRTTAMPPVALAIGNFDGLHVGHQAVLARMLEVAKTDGLVPAVLTFEPHPRRFFAPTAPLFRLETVRDKLARLRESGVARVFAPHFNAEFAALAAEDFLQRVLLEQLGARAIITGENFGFGRARSGTIATLRTWGAAHSVRTEQVAPVTVGNEVCSSTAIRHALGEGDMARARALLGRHYQINGRVVHGQARGRGLGFPTANIVPAPQLKLPRYGVYAVRVRLGNHWRDGVANLGVRPTVVNTTRPQFEVHLFDYTGDLYGQRLEVALIAHLRDEKRFDSLAALTHQIAQDAIAARQCLQEQS